VVKKSYQKKNSNLLFPGDPDFDYYLATLPPNWKQNMHQNQGQCAFVAEPGSGILRPANSVELTEYIEGGEYDERLAEIDELEQYRD